MASPPDAAEVRTHRALDPALSGRVEALAPGRARVVLETTAALAADEHGLVHGGFVFSLADHAAMVAINHANVVLGRAEVRFEKPVRVGQTLVACADAGPPDGKKRPVEVVVEADGEAVFRGLFVCFVPDRHVLAPGR